MFAMRSKQCSVACLDSNVLTFSWFLPEKKGTDKCNEEVWEQLTQWHLIIGKEIHLSNMYLCGCVPTCFISFVYVSSNGGKIISQSLEGSYNSIFSRYPVSVLYIQLVER